MKKKDPVKDFLEEKGCSQNVVEGGIPGLIKSWEQVVEEVSKGYALTLDDYLNDLDGRQILEEALAVAPEAEKKKIRERIAGADRRMQALVEPAAKCLWGSEVAEAEGWTPEKNWWYFSRPKKGDADFLAEIDDD
jgi:hypothetical protein